MEFKSGPIQISIGPKPRDREADSAQLRAIEAKLAAGQIEEAIALAEAALAQGLEHPLTFNLAAGGLEGLERYEEALALLERGHALTPADLGLRQALALCLFRLQRFTPALPHFDALIAAQPTFAPSHAARGATLEQLGRFDEAEAAFRRAQELEPTNLLALAGLANAASRGGRHAEARALAERVLAAEPGYPEAVVVLARADLEEGRYAEGDSRVRAMIADPRTSEAQKKFAETVLADIRAAKERKFDA